MEQEVCNNGMSGDADSRNLGAAIEEWLVLMEKEDASDFHLNAGSLPFLRVDGDLTPVEELGIVKSDVLKEEIFPLLRQEQKETFSSTGNLDFSLESGKNRYRCNLFMHNKGMGIAIRRIPGEIKGIDELRLPHVLKSLAALRKGLVLVTGPAGSGKSTTLAAMIDHINSNRQAHVITIEDPIEFVHENNKSLITQREVGRDTSNFAEALKAALREDPDVVLVGEMRDLETISLAVEAAATGHLVLSTLHTIGAAKTVDRVVDVFPAEEQNHIRSLLADVVEGVISQRLLKRATGRGRVPAVEIMLATTAIRNLIREGKTYQIPAMMEMERKQGMQTMDDAIAELVNEGRVSAGVLEGDIRHIRQRALYA